MNLEKAEQCFYLTDMSGHEMHMLFSTGYLPVVEVGEKRWQNSLKKMLKTSKQNTI